MSEYSVEIIQDSISSLYDRQRLITFQLRYPRFIHSEFMTHRMFSRNASSSRAIPSKKIIESVRLTPARPLHWGKDKPGMQATEELADGTQQWYEAAQNAADYAELFKELGYHKQIVNRITEPYQWISVVCTATEWDNFYDLRTHSAAQPEIRALALMMKEISLSSKPEVLAPGEWHLPYIKKDDYLIYPEEILIKCSVARCARVSYLNHDQSKPSVTKDVELYQRLLLDGHFSPFEHQGQVSNVGWTSIDREGNWWSGNFRHWTQLRQVIKQNDGRQ